MPHCEGLPGKACPRAVQGHSVRSCQGDLMLCSECENARFPSLPTPGNAKGKKRDSNREEKSTKTQTDSDIEQANLDCDTEELRDTVRKL